MYNYLLTLHDLTIIYIPRCHIHESEKKVIGNHFQKSWRCHLHLGKH